MKTFLQDVFKTSWRRLGKTSWRRLENVLKRSWRLMAKTSIFVLIKTSWKTSSEDEDERCLQDVFIKTNVCWGSWSLLFSQSPLKQVLWESLTDKFISAHGRICLRTAFLLIIYYVQGHFQKKLLIAPTLFVWLFI